MKTLVSSVVIGAAFAAMGCQEQARPPATPQASAQPAPPPAPPGPPGPPGPPAHAWGQGRPDMGPPHGEGPHGDGPHGEGMAHHERGPRHDGAGDHMGRKRGRPEHGGSHGEEMLHELGMMGVHFYPGPLVLRRAKDVGLTPDQTTKIRDDMLALRNKSIDLHAKIEHARVEMVKLLAADKVDEKAVGVQVDEAAKAEAEMHKLHVASMIRVRALLTPEQRQKLDEHHKGAGGGGPRPGAGPGRVGMADDDDDDDDE